MKRTTLSLLTAFIMALVILSSTSCKKEATQESNNKASTVDNNSALAEKAFKDLGNLTDQAINSGKKMKEAGQNFKQSENTCMTITLNLSVSPNVLTIDFGNANCLCEDGQYRRGIIRVTFAPALGDSLMVTTTTLEDYFVNDNQIVGTRVVTYNGHNAAGHINWDETVNGSIILANNGGTITYHSAYNFEMTEGENTLWVIEDNVYSLTGSSGGTTVTGQGFSNVITSPLIYKVACTWIVSGVIEVTPVGEPVRVLDYGNGECDNLAVITVSGYTINLILP
jgi:hypothetical protein